MARRWILLALLVGGAAIAWGIATHMRPARSKVSAIEERKKAVADEIKEMCGDAEAKRHAFESRHPKSTEVSKRSDPEKAEWKRVEAAKRDCEAARALLDPPLPIENYERDEQKACGELEKRQAAFDRRFPTKESQKNNDAVLHGVRQRFVRKHAVAV